MHNYSLNIVIALSVFGSLILFGIFNILFFLRKKFPIKVNCWFCNTNLRVPYKDYNSFTCIACQQYNGFSEDGNYNKEIPAQHYSRHNQNTYCQNAALNKKTPASNGFCEFCSRNQELKVLQLANFRPRCEEKYDEEIEEFRQKLEDSYQLCSQCQRHLNRTLNRVKTKFIGSKITQLKAKSLDALNQVTSKIITNDGKVISTMIILSIFILSIVNFQRDMNIELPPTDTTDSIVAIYNHFNAFLFTIVEILTSYVKEWELHEWIEDISFDNVAALALVLNLMLMMMWTHNKIRAQIILSMVSWAAKMISNEIAIDESYKMAVKGSIATLLVISSLGILIKSLRKSKDNASKNQDTSFHKITPEIFEDSDNECENSAETNSFYDFNNSRIAASTVSRYTSPHHHHNSKILNGSFCSRSIKAHDMVHHDTRSRFSNSSPKNLDVLSHKSFSIAKEVNSAERKRIQSDINRLTICDKLDETFSTSTTIRDFNSTMNPFSIEKNRSGGSGGSPTPSVASVFTSVSQRNLISPPRLHSPQVYLSDTTTSWCGGGYWTSPQKKFIAESNKTLISRSSSQSSGLGTTDSDTRENSIAQEEILSSIFSEKSSKSNVHHQPTNLFNRPPVKSLFENSFFPPIHRSPSILSGSASAFSSHNYTNRSFNSYRDSNGFL